MDALPKKMDYHMHSNFSSDGRQSVFEACQEASRLGLDEICFTEHLDPDPVLGMVNVPDFARWFEEIEAAQKAFPHLAIKKGMEIGDYAPFRSELHDVLKPLPLDFYLLSLHLVEGIDPHDNRYFEGKTQQQAYRIYLEHKLESVKAFPDYDGVAHLGYVGKFAPYPQEIRPLGYHHGPDLIDEILKTIIQKQKALEINASGLRNTLSPIPGADIIRRYLELGGQWFTFSSDAHFSKHLYYLVKQAKEIAVSQGAKWELRFENRKATPVPLI